VEGWHGSCSEPESRLCACRPYGLIIS
jgi:hypothetical protein